MYICPHKHTHLGAHVDVHADVAAREAEVSLAEVKERAQRAPAPSLLVVIIAPVVGVGGARLRLPAVLVEHGDGLLLCFDIIAVFFLG